jgi:RecA-family ATPase
MGQRGIGKTDYAMGVGLALASGQSIFGERIFQRCRIAILNLQHSLDELDRRLAALMIHHRIDRGLVEGRFFLAGTRDGRTTTAAQTGFGCNVVHSNEGAIIREIRKHNIDVLIVDPFAEVHVPNEEPNPQTARAAVAWRGIARTTNCAILLVQDVSTPSPQISRLRVVLERPPAGIS